MLERLRITLSSCRSARLHQRRHYTGDVSKGSNTFGKKEHAQEEQYFRKKEQEEIEKYRRELEEATKKSKSAPEQSKTKSDERK